MRENLFSSHGVVYHLFSQKTLPTSPQNLARIGILLSSLSRFLTLECGSGKTYCTYGYTLDNFMIEGSVGG